MTIDLLEALRNLYGAGGGMVPASSWTATVATVLWMAAYRDGLAAGISGPGGDRKIDEAAFRDAFADSLGWSGAQVDQFLTDPRYDFNP